MLAVSKLSFSYGAVEVLNGIDMTMPRGRITCILGRNGAGKTTLLMTLMGLLRSMAGAVHLDDVDVTDMPADRRSRLGLGLVPQGRRIFPTLTVEENLRVGLAARGRWRAQLSGDPYDLFPALYDLRGRAGGDLSGGQQQQLAIARALVAEPSVLLLDEPTEGIQPNVIQQIGGVLGRLARERGLAVVMVEQYLNFVKEVGDRFFLIDHRQVVASGLTADLSVDLVHRHLTV